MIDQTLIENLPIDPELAVAEFCERIVRGRNGIHGYDPINTIDLLTFFESFCHEAGVEIPKFPHSLDNSPGTKNNILSYFNSTLITLKRASVSKQAKQLFHGKYFTSEDKQAIFEQIEKLRTLISSSQIFDEDHRTLLLQKLDEFEIEIKSTTPSFDLLIMKFYRFTRWLKDTSDAAKPFLEPITELLKLLNKINPDPTIPIGITDTFLSLPPSQDC